MDPTSSKIRFFVIKHWLILSSLLVIGFVIFLRSWQQNDNRPPPQPTPGIRSPEAIAQAPQAIDNKQVKNVRKPSPEATSKRPDDSPDGLRKRFFAIYSDSSRDFEARSTLLRQIIGKMSRSGYTDDAIVSTQQAFGAGELRCSLISVAFRNCDLDSVEDYYGLLEFEDEKRSASFGISSALARQLAASDQGFAIDEKKLSFLSGDLNLVVERAAIGYFSLQSAAGVGGEILAQEIARSVTSKHSINEIAIGILHYDPFASWELITKAGSGTSKTLDSRIVDEMARNDPRKATETLVRSKQGKSHIPGLTSTWMQIDARGPINYLDKEKLNLSDVDADLIRMGIINYARSLGEVETADKWSQELSNPNLIHKAVE